MVFAIRKWHPEVPDLEASQPKAEEFDWLGGRDSNPDTQIQSLQSYR